MLELLPLVAIALIFWLLLIRPAQKRQKELARMQNALNTGDEVMLTSGFYGTLTRADGDPLEVEVSPGVRLRVARGAVGSLVGPAGGTDAPEAQPTDPDRDADDPHDPHDPAAEQRDRKD